MKISICTILKEPAEYVKEYMDYLVENFSEPYFEIIIVDNGLDCVARRVLEQYPIRIFDGIPGAFDTSRNIYLANAVGDYILIIDADERLTMEGISVLLNNAQQAKEDPNILGFTLPAFSYTGQGNWAEIKVVRFVKNIEGIHYNDKEMHAELLTANGEQIIKYSKFVYAPLHHYDCLLPGRSLKKRIRNVEKLEKIISNNPNDTTSIMFLGLEYVAQGQYERAERCYQKVLSVRPESDYTKYFYMLLCYKLNRDDEAMNWAIMLLDKNKYTNVCNAVLAACYANQKRYDVAQELLLDALKTNKLNPTIYWSLGNLLKHISPEKAVEYLHRAIELNPMLKDEKIYQKADGPNLYESQTVLIDRSENVFSCLATAYANMGEHLISEYYRAIGARLESFCKETV